MIKPLERLIDELKSLPGIGPRSARRIALHILKMNGKDARDFVEAIIDAKKDIHRCKVCHNLSVGEVCEICRNSKRDSKTICVVQDEFDVEAIERTGNYGGIYHVLGGVLSPIDGVGPENLRIKELVKRIKIDKISEIIIATNPDTEGENTAQYLTELLKELHIKVTRLASGLPIGSAVALADSVTLSKAFEGRKEM